MWTFPGSQLQDLHLLNSEQDMSICSFYYSNGRLHSLKIDSVVLSSSKAFVDLCATIAILYSHITHINFFILILTFLCRIQ